MPQVVVRKLDLNRDIITRAANLLTHVPDVKLLLKVAAFILKASQVNLMSSRRKVSILKLRTQKL